MAHRPRLVVDTNVIVSALLVPHSNPRRAFDKARGRGVIPASEQTIAELVRTLLKPKLERYVTLPEREAFLSAYGREVEIVVATTNRPLPRPSG